MPRVLVRAVEEQARHQLWHVKVKPSTLVWRLEVEKWRSAQNLGFVAAAVDHPLLHLLDLLLGLEAEGSV